MRFQSIPIYRGLKTPGYSCSTLPGLQFNPSVLFRLIRVIRVLFYFLIRVNSRNSVTYYISHTPFSIPTLLKPLFSRGLGCSKPTLTPTHSPCTSVQSVSSVFYYILNSCKLVQFGDKHCFFFTYFARIPCALSG
jgi:hypothetical protein